jgi:hypothetical protein
LREEDVVEVLQNHSNVTNEFSLSRVEAGYEAEDSQGQRKMKRYPKLYIPKTKKRRDFKLENLVTFGALQLLIKAEQTIFDARAILFQTWMPLTR